MTWKPTSEMDRDELVTQIELLRAVVERLAASIPREFEGETIDKKLVQEAQHVDDSAFERFAALKSEGGR